jgi:hypothetical protein
MKIEGYGVTCEFDGETLVLSATNLVSRKALLGPRSLAEPAGGTTEGVRIHGNSVVVPISLVTGLKVDQPSALVNGCLTIYTSGGAKYRAHFRRRQADDFASLEAAIERSGTGPPQKPNPPPRSSPGAGETDSREVLPTDEAAANFVRTTKGLSLTWDSIHYRGESGYVRGARATIAAGEVKFAPGIGTLAWVTGDEALIRNPLYRHGKWHLIVQGDGYQLVIPFSWRHQLEAARFADWLAARAQSDLSPPEE